MKNYSEVSLSEIPDEKLFFEISKRIESDFEGRIISEVNGLDAKYVDFDVNGKKISLHEETFIGIVVFPTALENAKVEENKLVETIGYKLNVVFKTNSPNS